jgi:hypothetical protein
MLTILQDLNRTISLASFFANHCRRRKLGFGLVPAAVLFFVASFASTASAQNIVVDVTPTHVSNTIRPTEAVGAGIDRIPYGAADKLYVDSTVKQVLAAGWQTVTYRQNTELHMEAWHWNPQGTWSDPAGKGYFTGSATPGTELLATSRSHARRWHRHRRLFTPDGW